MSLQISKATRLLLSAIATGDSLAVAAAVTCYRICENLIITHNEEEEKRRALLAGCSTGVQFTTCDHNESIAHIDT